VQTPVHAPALHTYWHGTGDPNWPLGPHVWTPLPEHCVAPGVHDPVHDPLLHTFGHAGPLFCQTPALLQVCGWRPLHCADPGVHVPVQVPPLQT
jgi:hypothetical protein